MNDLVTSVKQQLKEIAENQKKMTDFQERAAAADERTADAMEQIAGYIQQLLGSSAGNAMKDITEAQSEPQEAASKIDESLSVDAEDNGNDLLKTITDMREDGHTFGRIADHLIAEGIPTVDGIKQWNRLSVSKYYKEAEAS